MEVTNGFSAVKKQLRLQLEVARQTLSIEERSNSSKQISQLALGACMSVAQSRSRPMLFTFMPFRNEVDVTPLIRSWWDAGNRVVVPKR